MPIVKKSLFSGMKSSEPKPIKPTKPITNKIDVSQYKSTKSGLPDIGKPIKIFINENKYITAYRVNEGYISISAYELNNYLSIHKELLWQYISSCNNIKNCPNEFPQCEFCKVH